MVLISDGRQMQLVLNVGGPDRVSRVQMAEAVASVRGYNISLIKPVPASSVCGPFSKIPFRNLPCMKHVFLLHGFLGVGNFSICVLWVYFKCIFSTWMVWLCVSIPC